MEIALGIVMIVLTFVLAVAVLVQSSKDKRLSSSISGSGMSESKTFYGKRKTRNTEKIATYVTIIGGILFVILDVVFYIYLIA